MSMPIFWLGVILQIVFFARLGLLPIGRRLPPTMIGPPQITGIITIDALLAGQMDVALVAVKHLILPAITLGLVNLAILARITRSTLLDVLFQQYILVARSKGLTKVGVLVHHAIPNTSIPLVTIVGLMIGQALGGAIIVETIFQWPGIGRQVVNSLIQLDIPWFRLRLSRDWLRDYQPAGGYQLFCTGSPHPCKIKQSSS
jgi:peptide/nickel transport system permease protein